LLASQKIKKLDLHNHTFRLVTLIMLFHLTEAPAELNRRTSVQVTQSLKGNFVVSQSDLWDTQTLRTQNSTPDNLRVVLLGVQTIMATMDNRTTVLDPSSVAFRRRTERNTATNKRVPPARAKRTVSVNNETTRNISHPFADRQGA
jgi:hypothetical protein